MLKIIALNVVPILLIGLAALLICKNIDGWGWVIVAALCCTVYPKSIKNSL